MTSDSQLSPEKTLLYLSQETTYRPTFKRWCRGTRVARENQNARQLVFHHHSRSFESPRHGALAEFDVTPAAFFISHTASVCLGVSSFVCVHVLPRLLATADRHPHNHLHAFISPKHLLMRCDWPCFLPLTVTITDFLLRPLLQNWILVWMCMNESLVYCSHCAA